MAVLCGMPQYSTRRRSASNIHRSVMLRKISSESVADATTKCWMWTHG